MSYMNFVPLCGMSFMLSVHLIHFIPCTLLQHIHKITKFVSIYKDLSQDQVQRVKLHGTLNNWHRTRQHINVKTIVPPQLDLPDPLTHPSRCFLLQPYCDPLHHLLLQACSVLLGSYFSNMPSSPKNQCCQTFPPIA